MCFYIEYCSKSIHITVCQVLCFYIKKHKNCNTTVLAWSSARMQCRGWLVQKEFGQSWHIYITSTRLMYGLWSSWRSVNIYVRPFCHAWFCNSIIWSFDTISYSTWSINRLASFYWLMRLPIPPITLRLSTCASPPHPHTWGVSLRMPKYSNFLVVM